METKEQNKKGTTNLTLEIMNLPTNAIHKELLNKPLKQVSTLKLSNDKSYTMTSNCLWARVYLTGTIGASRVRKGTPGILPSGLLIPTVPWLQLWWTFTGNTCYGLHQKWNNENQWNPETNLVCTVC